MAKVIFTNLWRTFFKSLYSELLFWMAAIIFAAAFSSYLFNSLRSEPFPWVWPGQIEAKAPIEDLDELDRLLALNDTLLLDARDYRLYQLGHIPGAISLEADKAYLSPPLFLISLDPNALVVTYCSESLCPLGEKLAEIVRGWGHKNTRVFLAGIDGWLSAARPLEQDPGPKPQNIDD
ncbi:MAG: rhodanese-like domain-containing protein [Deltaproteobacteria bacterium]|jgi:rhodanese-related sulfurtransferase|nr:rhodanese-like domain-containing protein [Deltaproteobacteria bacterium]